MLIESSSATTAPVESAIPARPQWYAIWTRSNCEQLARDALSARGFEIFLPRVVRWRRRGGSRGTGPEPLFPGYLFVHDTLEKPQCVTILKTRGVVRLLGERWDRLTPVPDREIEAVRRLIASGSPVFRHRALLPGDRVRIVDGPLAGLEGRFVRARSTKGLFVVGITLLQRSVAVEIDGTLVEPA
jgi:transcription antitermination factor NusG